MNGQNRQCVVTRESAAGQATAPCEAGRWGLILAGGDGLRLRPLTRMIAGDERPKQFCPIVNGKTLLDITRERVTHGISRSHIFEVVNRSHQRFYAPLQQYLPPTQVVIQPANRGTAPAIVYSLLRIAARSPTGSVAIFPSDHYVSSDEVFMAYVRVAFDAVQENPDSVILLGIEPEGPEVQYGWIEPGETLPNRRSISIYRIRRFWEKPLFEHAKSLFARDCLWNTFVMVGHIPSILKLVERATPELYRAFLRLRTVLGTAAEAQTAASLYDAIPNRDFSHDVLAKHPERLAVLPVPGVSWKDWGEPRRVLNSLRTLRAVDGKIVPLESMSI